ncbi:hypothetical protein DPEC_G00356520 [Dallia pectoralis]|uniref:Uncharacterized protein n=1 Tax=Dallia pectoralis TaxID=75939 RepID=A0ACC2EZR7_DALPE|nr:hypothetical protein DPEC_G00356520 [Dallia pectoralis]
MAEAVDSINCSICQDQLKDPVTIPCGHSYCMGCIKDCLDQEDDKGIYSCPQCRQTFTPRPVLNRSTILSELVENLKKTKLQSPPPGHYSAGPGDVECDFCTGRKLKAVKSCLVCLASYCETHLQPHYESPAFKKHKLVQASTQLQEKICSHHDKLLEVFCRTDQQCICLLCVMDEHKGHETVSATTERAEKQEQLEEKHQKSQMRIQETEEDIQQLRQAVDSMKSSAQTTVDENEKIFSELIQALQRMHSEMNELIRAQEKAEVSRAEGLLEQLELELAKRKRIYVELKQLSNIEDHIHFLQSFQSLSVSLGSEVVPSVTYNHHSSFEHLNKSISELKDQLQELCKEKMYKISGKVTTVRIERPADPKTREDFLTYSCQLTLDLNTANQYLCLSEGNSKDLLKDPVTIPCGHSYCMGCIKDCLDQEEDKGIYSCPQCRQTFTPRPALNRNTTLSELVKKLKMTTPQSSPPGHCYAGPGDVECDFCTGRKLKAVKSCLVCLASYCETHLQPHYESPAFKKHKLVQASTQLQEKICSHHDKLLEVYCRTDQQCICYLCTMDEHKGHETVSATTERTEKQKQVGEKHQKCQKRIQEREKEIQELRKAVDSVKNSAQATVVENERIFRELIQSLQRRHSEMNELIRAQEKAESFQSLSGSLGPEVVPILIVNPHSSFEHVNKSISEMKDQLQDLCKEKMDKISGKVTTVRIERPADPQTREDFLTYSSQLTLDPNTANQYLCLSEGNSKCLSGVLLLHVLRWILAMYFGDWDVSRL